MTDSPRVIVLAGGLSHERDVSLRSGRRVAEALRSAGVEVSVHDVDADLIPALSSAQPDVVWPLLHGASGEDGSVRDVLELLGVAYVGTGPRAARVAWNKAVAKTVVSRAGLSTPEYVTLPQSLFRELGARAVLAAVVSKLGLPLVVKPSRGGSALGVTLINSAAELPQAMVDCFAYGDIALIERAVTGIEVAASVITTDAGLVALPPVEIVTDGPYDYDARYNPGRTEYFTPARLSAEQTQRVSDVAIAAHSALGLRHISRTDLILEPDGSIQFLEVNVAPGMTETSLFPQAAIAAGYELPRLYRDIVIGAIATQEDHFADGPEAARVDAVSA
jgi:D-alanine-D-alanine ligase